MNSVEMHIAWREYMDRDGALDSADFESEQIDFWLNQAIRQFVKERYDPIKKGFERTEKRTSDLENIVEYLAITCTSQGSSVSYKPNTYTATLPSDHWLTVGEEVTISYSDCHSVSQSTRQGITQTTEDEYRPMVDNAFSEHKLDNGIAKPLRLRKQKEVELISDGSYTVSTYYLTYIRKPAEVEYNTTNCDLSEHTHDEIVRKSVIMAVAALGDIEKYKIDTAEQSKEIN